MIPLVQLAFPRVAPALLGSHIRFNMSDLPLSCMRRISTKRKKEIYNLSSLLLHLIIFISLLISLGTSDEKENVQDQKAQPEKNEVSSPLEGLFANLKR
jgi:hypothetical protein